MDFSNQTVLCIGDVMIDRFAYADMERISPEAPVPVLRLKHVREMLGGAGNVANNIASLGGSAILVGITGRDSAGDAVRRLVSASPRITCALIDSPDRPTICKTRYVAGNQQVVRTDDESLLRLTAGEFDGLMGAIGRLLPGVGAIVLSDYGKSTLSPEIVASVIGRARLCGIPVFVDPKSRDFADYRGATCVTPNLREFAAAAGGVPDGDASLVAAADAIISHADLGAILVTRSERGMILVEASGEVRSVPARAREVFDVSGAGDTVIAAMALCVAGGFSLSQAMHVANAAAGVVVGKLGTATADVTEVMAEIEAQDHADGSSFIPGVQPVERVREMVARWKGQGLSVGFTNGCFDVLHPGHVALLAQARGECDRLVVALNGDASVRALKGPTRPVNDLASRGMVIAALRHVDCVVAFDEPTPIALIADLVPDVLVKGSDYRVESVVGADLVVAAGGRVVLADLVPGRSSTASIARMAAVASATP